MEVSGLLAIMTRRLFGSPAKAVLIIASAALAAGICVNALTLQQGAHPNPIFGAGKPATIVARPPATAVVKPQPAPQAARESATTASIAPAVQPATAAAGATAAAPVRRNDMIGDLLRGGPAPIPPQRPAAAPVQAKASQAASNQASGAPAAPKLAAPSRAATQKAIPQKAAPQKTATGQAATQKATTQASAKPAPAKQAATHPKSAQPAAQPTASPKVSTQVQSAQQALSKLGMGTLTADGVMGAGTRGAIERFEKSKGLPVTGVLGPKTVKALSAASGTAVR